MKAIRGAITVKKNTEEEILSATRELLIEIINTNNIKKEEMISILFTATSDLDSVYPALAARNIGLTTVPLLCFQEMNVKNSLNKCIRIMFNINRECSLDDISHVYLKKATSLRPDL